MIQTFSPGDTVYLIVYCLKPYIMRCTLCGVEVSASGSWVEVRYYSDGCVYGAKVFPEAWIERGRQVLYLGHQAFQHEKEAKTALAELKRKLRRA